MKVGDLCKNIHTGEFHIITAKRVAGIHTEEAYYEVDGAYMVPEEHLVVLNESR